MQRNLITVPLSRLVEADANVRTATAATETPLSIASGAGHATAVQVLLRGGATPWATDVSGRTALHAAAMEGHDEVPGLP